MIYGRSIMTSNLPAGRLGALALALGLLAGSAARAQTTTTYSENFTGSSTTNSWYFINGACLTAGTGATSTAANPACVGSTYYTNKGDTLIGGDTGTLPDTAASGGGALRFTNWFNENGAILSNFNFPLSSTGLAVSFTTVTYEGDSGGGGGDGADGISFFLQNATSAADVGAFGGSLGYTCSNTNNDATLRPSGQPRGFDGLAGGYVGLGIDEYGNFLNSPDNTSSGDPIPTSGGPYASGASGQYQPGRIGMRGPGSTTWSSLNATYPTLYPSSLSNATRAQAVQSTCSTGHIWDYSLSTPAQTSATAPNYTAIPNAWQALPASEPIANESATTRSQGTPITYNLKITSAGLLSLTYSYNGGALQTVISGVDITSAGANPLPATIRFGFAGSTGGSRNIHEVMCFQATPSVTAQSSATLNQKQTAQVQAGTQLYFAFYNPATLAGSVTAENLVQSVANPNLVTISPTINWDASCVLTGVTGSQCDPPASGASGGGPAGPTPAQGSASRVILSFAPSSTASTSSAPGPGTGIPFQWASLTSAEQPALDTNDSTSTTLPQAAYRLAYLRGDRTQEQTPSTTNPTQFNGLYRDRASVLGDIIDSSPVWVGPPNATFPGTWVDALWAGTSQAVNDVLSENSGQAYTVFSSSGTSSYTSGTAANNHEAQRLNVVYAGANDGMLHGFRSGSFNGTAFQNATNDGHEVLAYVPAYIVNTIQSSSVVNNYSDPQYGHKYDVDASPGTGDLFYNGVWHTWLVGGLGPGGNAIYALDVTDPAALFTESSGSNAGPTAVVRGEWGTYVATTVSGGNTTRTVTSTTMNCVGDGATPCGNHLGNTYGIPQIRRFHNGSWGAVFGNGLYSQTADAGIFVMLVDPSSGAITFYYVGAGSSGTGTANNPNGIAYVTAADLDGDHITDYVYAGDIQGHVWRFDLTSTNPNNWTITAPALVYTTPGSQPITSKVSVIAASSTGSANPHVLVEFGTGQQVPMTNYSSATFATAAQALYGIWDWNLATWNTESSTKYAALSSHSSISGTSAIQVQTITSTTVATAIGTGTNYRTVSQNAVCYADVSGCSQFGWYMNLVSGYANPTDPATPTSSTSTNPMVYEQVIFNPIVEAGAFIVNTTIPAASASTMCFSSAESGWTMAIDPATGGAFNTAFFADSQGNFLTTGVPGGSGQEGVSGVALAGTGTPYMYQSGTQYGLAMQTAPGTPVTLNINPQNATSGKRLTWIEKR
jgi:type IV pilus assembly protein PilY1